MILKLCIFTQWPSRSGLYQLQRHYYSVAMIICSWSHCHSQDFSFYVTIFILGSYSWWFEELFLFKRGLWLAQGCRALGC